MGVAWSWLLLWIDVPTLAIPCLVHVPSNLNRCADLSICVDVMNNLYQIGHWYLFMMVCNCFWHTYTIMQMVREWMYGTDRRSGEFINGVHEFLRVADANKRNAFVFCPCSVCKNQKDYSDSKIPQKGFPSTKDDLVLRVLMPAAKPMWWNLVSYLKFWFCRS